MNLYRIKLKIITKLSSVYFIEKYIRDNDILSAGNKIIDWVSKNMYNDYEINKIYIVKMELIEDYIDE